MLVGINHASSGQEKPPAANPTNPASESVRPAVYPPATEDVPTNEESPQSDRSPLEPKPVGPVVGFEPFSTNSVPVDRTFVPTLSYLNASIPLAPWQSQESLPMPEWAPLTQPSSPFLRTGLGTTAIGGPILPAPPAPRNSRGSSAPIQLGPIDFRPSLGYQVVYGSGLTSRQNDDTATLQHTISPSVAIYAGDHWTVGYTPSIRIYDAEGYENSVNHAVTLSGWAQKENWGFRISHASAISSDPLIETAQQTDQITHSTTLGASWDRGPQGSYSFSLAQNLRDTTQANDISSWNSENWYDYPLRPKVRLGVGIGFGYDMIDPGSDMLGENLNLRVSGPLGQRIRYSLTGGAGIRQFLDTDSEAAISPRLSLNVSYQVFERTATSLGVSHDTGTSYFSDQYTENTSLQGSINQRLTDRWTATVSGGYRFTSYRSTASGNRTEREDGSTFANASLGARILPRLFCSVFYSYRSNDSDSAAFGFDSHQVGASIQWTM